MSPPGGRRRASATFEVPISRRHQAVHFKALKLRRGRASHSRRGRGRDRNSRRGRSGPGHTEGQPQSPSCQDHVAEQAPVSSSSKLLGTLKESSTATTSSSTPQALRRDTTEISASSGRRLSSSPGPTILHRKPPDWYLDFYIRMDYSGSFRTYPDVGGPFKSLQEADNAIDCHLHGLQHEAMCKESLDKLSPMDSLIRRALYWPDGKRRKCSEAFASENTEAVKDHLVESLVDKYNEDHKLFGDHAHELKDALHSQIMWESKMNIWYYHFNFTTKIKEAGGIDNLFFAEVTCMEGDELAVGCFCMINTDANGCCYGCTNNGSVGMKHPNEANAYNAGHPDDYLPYGHSGVWVASDDDDVKDFKDEEDRIRHHYKGLDDPDTLKKIYAPSPYATDTFY